ncbi:MAG TPA: phosphate ABC transporter permease PstA [Phycisphaerae bacterium]|nr:phosphate ABC transporter permease PstA [Phycisphaerae bacterium]
MTASAITPPTVPPIFSSGRPRNRLSRYTNLLAKAACTLSALLALSVLFLILGFVLYRGVGGLSLNLFTKLPGPVGSPIGMENCIIGTIILIAISSAIGVPVGMLCGIYLAEYSRGGFFAHTVRLLVDVIAGTPSIVVGVLGYELIVVPTGHFSGWAGGAALAFLMCPIVARTTEDMLKLVPKAYREGSIGVGASKSQTLFRVVLPAARAGIITGLMLAIARVAGETAPLLFTALGNDQLVVNPSQPFPSLTLEIFKYATSAEDQWRQQAWAGMLVLVSIIVLLSAAVRYTTRRTTHAR